MSIEWLLTKAQSAEVREGTLQFTPEKVASSDKVCNVQSRESGEHETDGRTPIYFRCRCGYEGTLIRGDTEVQLSTSRNGEVVCFKCTNCGRHLQYDCLNGTMKVRKGIVRAFLERFR